MDLSVSLREIYVPENIKEVDEIKFKVDILNLGENSKIYEDTKILKYSELMEHGKKGYLQGNFTIKNKMPSPVNTLFGTVKEPPSNKVEDNLGYETVLGIITRLAEMDTVARFSEKYYKNTTSGVIFDTFSPELQGLTFPLRNLIISRKKFNLVFVTSIKGTVQTEGGVVEAYRYFPFKFIRYGKLLFDNITVRINDNNREYIQTLEHTQLNEEDVVIHLDKYPITTTLTEDHVTANNLLTLIRNKKGYRSILKAYRYYLHQLKIIMETRGINPDKRDWFNGEEVDESYLSDRGTQFLEVWEKGKKSVINTESLLNELDVFGESTKHMLQYFLTVADLTTNEIADNITACEEAIMQLFKNNTINRDEYLMLMSLSNAMSLTGTYEQRYRRIKTMIKDTSFRLNLLEVKFLTLRWNLFNSEINPTLLGEVINKTTDKADVKTPFGILVIKRGEVTDLTTPRISSDIENREEKCDV